VTSRKAEMHQGRIVWFDLKTGRGCVVCRDTLEDYLFDSKGINSPGYFLHEGEEVLFEIEETEKNRRARNVRLARNQESQRNFI